MRDETIGTKTDTEILWGIRNLAKAERKLKVDFLTYLNEVDNRKLFASEGYSSLYSFLTEHLHFSESSALKRIHVARLGKKFPEIYPLISEGRVSLSSVELVAPHLTNENSAYFLETICGKSVRKVEHFLATQFPKPEQKDKVQSLSEDKFLIQFSADQAFLDNLNHAKALLGKKFPSGKLVHILGEAISLLLENEGWKKGMSPEDYPPHLAENYAEQELSREFLKDPLRKNTPRYIPRGIRREVWHRDAGKCQFPRKEGGICGATNFLEFDHVIAWAYGGSSHSAQNVQLLCRTHNQLKGMG